jgi:hypothetical protein
MEKKGDITHIKAMIDYRKSLSSNPNDEQLNKDIKHV